MRLLNYVITVTGAGRPRELRDVRNVTGGGGAVNYGYYGSGN